MKTTLLTALLLAGSLFAEAPWESKIPEVIYPDAALTDLYTNTWRIAYGRIREAPAGAPVSPYMDENCYDDQIWIWDTCFMTFFTKYCPEIYPGIESLDNLYSPLVDAVPSPLTIHFYDNPPLFAWCELHTITFTADRKRIDRIIKEKQYPQRHYDGFKSAPTGKKLPSVANAIHIRPIVDPADGVSDYIWSGTASGMDNTPRGRDAGGWNKIFWVDAISQQALSAKSLSQLHLLLGDRENTLRWFKEFQTLRDHINAKYWDEKDGFYYDISAETGEPCRIKTPASFWPLLAGVATQRQAARMVETLKDPALFGGPFPIPTLARNDKDYNDATGDYWRGGIWLPATYMVVKALERYGYTDLADDIAEKTLRQQLATYRAIEPHTIWECYSPSANAPSTEHGRRARPDFCGWSALGPISLFIENILGIREVDAIQKIVTWDVKRDKGIQGIRNLRVGDTTVCLIYNGKDTVTVTTDKPFFLVINYTRRLFTAGTTELKL